MAAQTYWTEDEWKFIVQDAKCAREDVKLLRRMGANAVRRWAKRAIAKAAA